MPTVTPIDYPLNFGLLLQLVRGHGGTRPFCKSVKKSACKVLRSR